MRRKITFLVVSTILVTLASVGSISYFTVGDTIKHKLEDHLLMATIISREIDFALKQSITRLLDISISGHVNLRDGDWAPESRALKTAYEYSIFNEGLYMLDTGGNVFLTHPRRESMIGLNMLGIPYIARAMDSGMPQVSDIYRTAPTEPQVILIIVPLKDRDGAASGLVMGMVNPASYLFDDTIKTIDMHEDTTVELVDSQGMVITSNMADRILTVSDHDRYLAGLISRKQNFVGTCHRCHANDDGPRRADMIAFAPLPTVPWGISIRVPSEEIYKPARKLRNVFIVVGLIYLATAVLLAIGLSRSIVNPIRTLTSAAHRMSQGDLDTSINVQSPDEIGVLASSLDSMRRKLQASNEQILRQNAGLEQRVAERTARLEERETRLSILLGRIINAQEEERKRIARELHDETSQNIAALGMSIDVAMLAMKDGNLGVETLADLKAKTRALLDGVSLMIQDLRPLILDDLGFESAVRWLLEKHLPPKGIGYELTVADGCCPDGRLPIGRQGELTLFRVIQEAIINTAKHSGASSVNVAIRMVDNRIEIDVADDGRGLESAGLRTDTPAGDFDLGYGLMGMRERVTNIGGTLFLTSNGSQGTRIHISVPTERNAHA